VSKVAFDYKPKATAPRTGAHAKWFISGLAAPLIGGAVVYGVATQRADQSAPELNPPVMEPALLAAPEIANEIKPPPLPQPLGDTVEFVVRRNDTLDRIFRHLSLNLSDLASIRDLPGARESLDALRPGDTITLIHDGGVLQSFRRRISETEILSVTRAADGFAIEVLETPVEIREAHAHGAIESSLFVSARAAGVSPEIILQLANDVFGWQIDFALDIQPGDRFNIVYEQKYRDGEYIGDGRILAADFTNNGSTYRAVYYESPDGQVADYFAPDGRSMRRQFLRAPLDFTRISSNFNPRRRHPILNAIRAHKGVDYAAPTGTLIKAAADGRVAFAGVKGGYGRVVILEHGSGVTTLYGHMSRFAKGMRNGQRVRQGVAIGYVGSSGAATGPHLHYEYRVNGAHKNPRTVRLPDAAPLSLSYMADFQARSSTLLARLDRARDSAVAVLPAD
jgi:murein DD-endopeptidase MepM/ murein hydrolase activator NlpD